MIFVAVEPGSQAGRLIAAQLKFFGAGEVPVYANADIFEPAATARYNDLNGFIFADTPALLTPDETASEIRADLQAFWPQRGSFVRYYGMGYDAYGLISSLYANDGSPWSIRGLSGDLSLDAQGRVRRVLPLGQFRNGRPAALDTSRLPPIDSSGLIGLR
jgi:outer membrane PBP1 activator LpoA protein